MRYCPGDQPAQKVRLFSGLLFFATDFDEPDLATTRQRCRAELGILQVCGLDGVPRQPPPDKINKSYAELATRYTALVDPAQAANPKDKSQVERRPMPCARDLFWRGREFTSIEHMQAEAVTWPRKAAGRRKCRQLGGAVPLSVFEAICLPRNFRLRLHLQMGLPGR
ncbi:hypothetical protein [Streptomyces lutosisoli]|uniref:Transposase n=1 Tax=Streptomyces lutosisoli TaxID=2665721 RepID=A0ABW2VWW5_9ACTN